MRSDTAIDAVVQSAALYKSRPAFLRMDVCPFAVLYALLIAGLYGVYDSCLEIKPGPALVLIGIPTWKNVALQLLPVCLLSQFVLFLLSNSIMSLKCDVGHRRVSLPSGADCIFVRAGKNSGKDRIVPLRKNSVGSKTLSIFGRNYSTSQYWFEFQKKIYNVCLDHESLKIQRQLYPSIGSIRSILSHSGLDEASAAIAGALWGKNEFDIPLPGFLELYQEHLTAPFFLFQVICLFLWSLDDYWYYSAVTLVMLMSFEGLLCKQRQNNLQMLREMRRPPIPMYRLRRAAHAEENAAKNHGGGSTYLWELVNSDSLVPGDIISVAASIGVVTSNHASAPNFRLRKEMNVNDSEVQQQQVMMPCDVVIISGSCVVNEAMLTGESTPQVKESINCAISETNSKDAEDTVIDLDGPSELSGQQFVDATVNFSHRRYQIYGGTTLLQHTASDKASDSKFSSKVSYPLPPNKGCVAVVIRTGFGTVQGELMRKILFASERVNSNSMETFYFIGLLVIFALAASAWVLHEGLKDESRNVFKLFLHCIMIITSVVPPELPMELSLAVTHSLAALSKAQIFCTEPFRIPFAGRLNYICLDKTGTLTQDKLIFRGLVAAPLITDLFVTSFDHARTEHPAPSAAITDVVCDASKLPGVSLAVMGACHSLFRDKSGKIIGDPLEIVTFEKSGYDMDASGMQYHLRGSNPSPDLGLTISAIRILYRYPFSSALKRMSVVAEITILGTTNEKHIVVMTKGAPEVLVDKLAEVPECYRDTYLYHMSRGKRVLALAFRVLSDAPSSAVRSLPRDTVEQSLSFVGLIVFDSELKADTKSVVKVLRNIDAKVILITGDSAFTAAEVARKLKLTAKGADGASQSARSVLILMPVAGTDGVDHDLVWRQATSGDRKTQLSSDIVFNPLEAVEDTTKELSSANTLCVTGPALTYLLKRHRDNGVNNINWFQSILRDLVPNISIFARVSPAQKESIVLALNEKGKFTLMCGDGTNDVGALRAAHVGVSIVNCPELEDKVELQILKTASLTSGGAEAEDVPGDLRQRKRNANSKKASSSIGDRQSSSQQDRMLRAVTEMQMQDMDPTIVKLGDASIASPFTSRRTSVDAVLTVIRHGRCTLVTMIQIFKILALNCLCSAYLMSALYLRGLKQGDSQMTAAGLVTAALFFFLSQAKPLQSLSPHAPPHSVFCLSVMSSILGQFVVHLISLLAVLNLCERYEFYGVDVQSDPETLSSYAQHMYSRQYHRRISIPDSKFQPNLLNSAIYILSIVIQTNNFVINYRGAPFTQNLTDNKYLFRSVQVIYFVIFVLLSDCFEPLNDLLELEKFPCYEFQYMLGVVLALNFGCCWLVERFCQKSAGS